MKNHDTSKYQHVMGIDADTKGIAWHTIDTYGWHLVDQGFILRKHPKKGIDEDYPDILRGVLSEAARTNTWIFLEDIFCMNRTGFKLLAQVQGEILYEARNHLFDFNLRPGARPRIFTVLASQWQPEVFSWYGDLQGTSKEKAREATGYFAGEVPLKDEHMVDACCIAHYGRSRYNFLMRRIEDVGEEKAYAEVRSQTPFR